MNSGYERGNFYTFTSVLLQSNKSSLTRQKSIAVVSDTYRRYVNSRLLSKCTEYLLEIP